MSEIALRVVIDLFEPQPAVVGTAVIVGPGLVLTAKHILADYLDAGSSPSEHTISLIQVFRVGNASHEYAIWALESVILHPSTDLALLHVRPEPQISGDRAPPWRLPTVAPLLPDVGQNVAGFGYRRSSISVSTTPCGGRHVDLEDEPMVGVGTVREKHESGRGFGNNFPSFRVDAPFARGMSGGPVFDEAGALCGIISFGYERQEGHDTQADATEYVAAIWPLFAMSLTLDRGKPHPQGPFPAFELARDGSILVDDLDALLVYIDGRK